MTTLRKYVDVVKAEMDKSLLEAAGIPAFIAGENSASIGYGSILTEIHLQVQDADIDRARQVLQDNNEATPLSADFVPPETPSAEAPNLKTGAPSKARLIRTVFATVVALFVILVAFTLWKASHTPADPNRVIAISNKTIELFPRDAHAYYNRGFAKRAKGDLGGAIADYDKAIELDPKYVLAYVNRSSAKWVIGDLNGAIVDCDRAIELDPKNINACITCGSTKGINGDLDGAIVDYNRVIALDPKDARGYNGRGNVERLKGDLDNALVDYNTAIELNPKNLGIYHNRGLVHYEKRDWNSALTDFRKASTMKLTDSKSTAGQDYLHICIWLARARLGERDAATSELKEYLLTRTIGKPGDWPSTIARFLTGDISESDFLKAADSGDEKHLRDQKCEAYFYVGTVKLIDGDKSAATDYFTKCLETGSKKNYEYQSAAVELEALKH